MDDKADMINHPPHYGDSDSPYEVIKIIEFFGFGYRIGNAVKYILRAGKKGDYIEDLKKAQWYLQREIDNAYSHRAKEKESIAEYERKETARKLGSS